MGDIGAGGSANVQSSLPTLSTSPTKRKQSDATKKTRLRELWAKYQNDQMWTTAINKNDFAPIDKALGDFLSDEAVKTLEPTINKENVNDFLKFKQTNTQPALRIKFLQDHAEETKNRLISSTKPSLRGKIAATQTVTPRTQPSPPLGTPRSGDPSPRVKAEPKAKGKEGAGSKGKGRQAPEVSALPKENPTKAEAKTEEDFPGGSAALRRARTEERTKEMRRARARAGAGARATPATAAPPPPPPPAEGSASGSQNVSMTVEEEDPNKQKVSFADIPTYPTPIDMIPPERLSNENKTEAQLRADIKYFMTTFGDQLKSFRSAYKKMSKMNKVNLKSFHARIVGRLDPKKKSETSTKFGVVIDAEEYIRQRVNEVMIDNAMAQFSPEQLRPVATAEHEGEKKDSGDVGNYEIKRAPSGKLAAQREPIYKYIPTTADPEEEKKRDAEPFFRRSLTRVKLPKSKKRTVATGAIRDFNDDPFLDKRRSKRINKLF